MVTPAEDASQQLYRSLFRVLTEDVELMNEIGGTSADKRVYQFSIDLQTGQGLQNIAWVEYGITAAVPEETEQIQQVWRVRYSVYAYTRGVGGSKAEAIEKRTRQLLNQHGEALVSDSLFVWYNLARGYKKSYDSQAELWRVEGEYETMCMAIDPTV